jgi:hypothetical protein
MSEKEFKTGVYMKPNGKLVLVTFEFSEERNRELWHVYDGKKANSRLIRAFYPKVKDRPDIVLTGDSLGWGPSSYLNKSEYLGEL